jgi:hypothetical protein
MKTSAVGIALLAALVLTPFRPLTPQLASQSRDRVLSAPEYVTHEERKVNASLTRSTGLAIVHGTISGVRDLYAVSV